MRNQTSLLVGAMLAGAALGALAAWRLASIKSSHPVILANSGAQRVVNTDQSPRLSVNTRLAPTSPPAMTIASPQQALAVPAAPARLPQPPAVASVSDVATANDARIPDAGAAQTQPINPPANTDKLNQDAIAERAFRILESTSPRDPLIHEQRCTAGEASDCLSLAELLSQPINDRQQAAKVRAYRERAYSIFVPQCHHRNPDACVAIARMHARGLGLPKDPASVSALLDRARQLCRHHPAEVCVAFGP